MGEKLGGLSYNPLEKTGGYHENVKVWEEVIFSKHLLCECHHIIGKKEKDVLVVLWHCIIALSLREVYRGALPLEVGEWF